MWDALKHCMREDWKGKVITDYTCCESALLDKLKGGAPAPVPYYIIFLELEGDAALTDNEKLKLDESLRRVTYPYESFRCKDSIAPMVVHVVPVGCFAEFRGFIVGNSMASSNQLKIPRMLSQAKQLAFLLDRIK
ncbi:PREDICTED: uncharacterized protein LOC106813412 [Priapulus caudatus]|uniref:Uncharacterized protein LOC106813412 n=1 Tax=Priapulus caudatus TaxID=37621 RepID=A0ABM1ELG1_PRICU|nr:PREDICTED: uncharacterized protein LOC106813412 [Priapulus caudatus]